MLHDWQMNFHIFWGSDLYKCLCSAPSSLDQASAGFIFASAHFCLFTQQTYPVFWAAGVRLEKHSAWVSVWDFHCSLSVLWVLPCCRTQKGISLYRWVTSHLGCKEISSVSQHLFVLLTFLFQCVLIFFGLYMQNEKLGLKICHNMSEELFTKSYTCFQTICSQ